MAKRIHHMGMTLTKEEHNRFHAKSAPLTARKHAALMKRLGVTPEQDAEWHRTHQTLDEQRSKGLVSINCFAVGGGFLAWCVKQGWLVQQGKQYLATRDGARQLHEKFGINV